ncbi:uncharacterized protein LOC111888062 [Lactuca sativa]|uniref:rRNA methyltransferase 1, mitochondrial n=1 Tax=Lactuca sativa TaxID=4236 RepID=A0A9R1XAN4_LACSA|nr:uncharacterized protein LOC111888062 [Lactuca sativa]KAJ0203539.1 hypothetical protein LSAT_V11C500281540 [Lactuca sativa]
MYCNFTKCHAFPFAIRASSQPPKCFLPFYIKPKTPQFSPISNPETNVFYKSRITSYRTPSVGFMEKTHEYCQLLGTADRDSFVSFNQHVRKKREHVYAAKSESLSNGLHSNPRKFSTSYSRKVVEGTTDSPNPLPWLAKNKDKEVKDSEKEKPAPRRSSWEISAEKFSKNGTQTREKIRRKDFKPRNKTSEDESATRKFTRVRSSWETSAEKFVKRGDESRENGRRFNESRENGKRFDESRENTRRFDERNDYRERRISEDDSDLETQEADNNNPNWYKIQERFESFDRVNVERNDKWSRQDNWGKKVWKEATESSIPKMVGECVYGVGPVLAALLANRREFYVLYIQEGIDLTGNNKKKKDKKGFEKVLKVADKLGLTIKEISKHDLNMIVDNRPHQGLVLDASPLEMVNIRELDRTAGDMDMSMSPLWLALDEVMDPQNLGAIIRSAYFFGAAGVVLCAKNSAPLSGVVSKASAGSLELIELRCCKNMMQFLVSSAENGWRVVGGSVSSRAVGLTELRTGEPTVLVLGSEGTGLRPLVERSCTELVKIPGNIPVHLSGGFEDGESFVAVESLNVSVAAGVLLHHFVGNSNNKTVVDIEG